MTRFHLNIIIRRHKIDLIRSEFDCKIIFDR